MRVAAIYDIHGNLPALEAVLEEIEDEGVDCIVVGGDVIAGPMPGETLSVLQEITIPTHFLHGNAESELLRYLAGKDPQALSERAAGEAYWGAENLSDEHKAFLSEWPATCELQIEGYGNVLFCHATPNSDIKVFTKDTPETKLAGIFERHKAPLVVCGHTHMQFDRTIEDVRVVNAGSVGMPFGHTGADWLLIADEIEFRHTDYDISKAAEKIRQSNYAHAENFVENNVLSAPTKEQARKMLSQLEALQADKE
ncbi:MAG: metallophosphoesterase family protein [Balneolaceae bacterium]|nr:metallophosphoesterase family protein [Balneolaceae bacterium]